MQETSGSMAGSVRLSATAPYCLCGAIYVVITRGPENPIAFGLAHLIARHLPQGHRRERGNIAAVLGCDRENDVGQLQARC
jgi:hypothetical protein